MGRIPIELFWRTTTWHDPGGLVPPRWGSVVMGFGPRHDHFGREMLLETARRQVAPEAVSRLAATFTFRNEEEARAWQDERHLLYRVSPLECSDSTTQVNMTVLERWGALHTFDDLWDWAGRYWTEAPAEGEVAEILVGGSLQVVELISDLRFPL